MTRVIDISIICLPWPSISHFWEVPPTLLFGSRCVSSHAITVSCDPQLLFRIHTYLRPTHHQQPKHFFHDIDVLSMLQASITKLLSNQTFTTTHHPTHHATYVLHISTTPTPPSSNLASDKKINVSCRGDELALTFHLASASPATTAHRFALAVIIAYLFIRPGQKFLSVSHSLIPPLELIL